MKNFFDYIFHKYYWFQVKVGNADRAVFLSVLLMSFISFLYTSCLFLFASFFFKDYKMIIHPWYGVILLIVFFIIFYRLYSCGSKFDKIINNKDFSKKNNLLVIIITVFAFLLINVIWIFKMLQNQGKI